MQSFQAAASSAVPSRRIADMNLPRPLCQKAHDAPRRTHRLPGVGSFPRTANAIDSSSQSIHRPHVRKIHAIAIHRLGRPRGRRHRLRRTVAPQTHPHGRIRSARHHRHRARHRARAGRPGPHAVRRGLRRDLVAGHRRARRAAAAVQRVLQRHQPRRLTAATRHGGQDRRVPAAQHTHRVAAHPWPGQRLPHRRRLPVRDAHRLPATRGARRHRHDHQPVPVEPDGELVVQPGRAGGAVLAARRHRLHGCGLHRLRTRDGQTVQGRHRRRRRRTLQGHADHRRFHPVRRALPDRLRGRR